MMLVTLLPVPLLALSLLLLLLLLLPFLPNFDRGALGELGRFERSVPIYPFLMCGITVYEHTPHMSSYGNLTHCFVERTVMSHVVCFLIMI
jgi:hypothetical protein